ncbi:unnamed protein product [Polarella glacialis]|uniref:Uncharacterized protein n=1 Tax=Polarella glacialis TaxID=89957 RepID=A0A813I248_POLGL|nr:unnamed protein product [Polarella glacialis]
MTSAVQPPGLVGLLDAFKTSRTPLLNQEASNDLTNAETNARRLQDSHVAPDVLLVSGAGWEKANGIYLPSHVDHSGVVYKNGQGFLVSYEEHARETTHTTRRWLGWILGIGGKPLYTVQSNSPESPPPGGWRAVRDWGREPVPTVCTAVDVVDAVLVDVRSKLITIDKLAQQAEWQAAAEELLRTQDQLSHLLDVESPEVTYILAEVQEREQDLPLKQAKALKKDGDETCILGDWPKAQKLYQKAHRCLVKCDGPEAEQLRSELLIIRQHVPLKRLEQARTEAKCDFQAAEWAGLDAKLELVQHCMQAVKEAGMLIPLESAAEVEEMRLECTLQRVLGVKRSGDTEAARGTREGFAAAELYFATALKS